MHSPIDKRLNGKPLCRLVKIILSALSLLIWLVACQSTEKLSVYDKIIENRVITVITRNNPWCYYTYRERPMGFEYDLAKAFADFMGVRLKVKVANRWEGMISDLLSRKGDFIAASMTITQARQDRVLFSAGYQTIQPHIVVHRHQRRLKSAEDLAGKVVHVSRGTSYHEHLEVLKAADIDFQLILHDNIETTELIRQVAKKKISATVADDMIAMLSRRYYPQIKLAGPISDEEKLGWAVSPNAHRLKKEINLFFAAIKKNGQYEKIFNRYFTGIESFDFVDMRAFHREVEHTLPRYLPFILNFAEAYGFDWRLIAAQMYQESHYDPVAVSRQGAHGLMQISLRMAEKLNVVDIYDPCQNIEAGVRHLKSLYDFYDKAKGKDRLYIALAAYNVGVGHMLDARDLARNQGLDPEKWSSLVQTLPLLSDPKYYEKTKYGYCRGNEPVQYINNIIVYYDVLRYKRIAQDKQLG